MMIFIDTILILIGFVRILYFLQVWSEFGLFISMVTDTIKSIVPFLFFFFMWVTMFSFVYMNFKIEIEDVDDTYPHIPKFFKFFFKSFRDALGDISAPGYKKWYVQ